MTTRPGLDATDPAPEQQEPLTQTIASPEAEVTSPTTPLTPKREAGSGEEDGGSDTGRKYSAWEEKKAFLMVGFVFVLSSAGYWTNESVVNRYAYISSLEMANSSDLTFNVSDVDKDLGSLCQPNLTAREKQVLDEAQDGTSRLLFFLSLAVQLPSLFTIMVLGAYSDILGRRFLFALAIAGQVLNNLTTLAVLLTQQAPQLLFVGSALHGLCGGFDTVKLACYTYAVDIARAGCHRTTALAVVQAFIGVGGILVHSLIGWSIQNWEMYIPIAISLGIFAPLIVGLVIAAYREQRYGSSLPATANAATSQDATSQDATTQDATSQGATTQDATSQNATSQNATTQATTPAGSGGEDCGCCGFVFPGCVRKVCRKVRGFYGHLREDKAKRPRTVLLAFAFFFLMFPSRARFRILFMYEVNFPLCWKPLSMGLFRSFSEGVQNCLGYVIIKLLKKFCELSDEWAAIFGLLSLTGADVMTAFAKDTGAMYGGASIGLLGGMPNPILRSLVSQLVSPDRQGTLFAHLSVLEIAVGILGQQLYVFYRKLFRIMPGAVFIVMAVSRTIAVICVVLLKSNCATLPPQTRADLILNITPDETKLSAERSNLEEKTE